MKNGNSAFPLSIDHKPNLPGEKKRIIEANHSVGMMNRVDGDLALSRAFGDFRFKDHPRFPPEK